MKQDITFCDVCGKQTTEFFSDGHPLDAGIHIRQESPGRVWLEVIKLTDCGSSDKAGVLRGRDYCSEECLCKDLNAWFEDALLNIRVEVKS